MQGSLFAHPLQCRDQIENADIAGRGETLIANARKIEVTEDIEAVVHRDDHDVVASDKIGACRSAANSPNRTRTRLRAARP